MTPDEATEIRDIKREIALATAHVVSVSAGLKASGCDAAAQALDDVVGRLDAAVGRLERWRAAPAQPVEEAGNG